MAVPPENDIRLERPCCYCCDVVVSWVDVGLRASGWGEVEEGDGVTCSLANLLSLIARSVRAVADSTTLGPHEATRRAALLGGLQRFRA